MFEEECDHLECLKVSAKRGLMQMHGTKIIFIGIISFLCKSSLFELIITNQTLKQKDNLFIHSILYCRVTSTHNHQSEKAIQCSWMMKEISQQVAVKTSLCLLQPNQENLPE